MTKKNDVQVIKAAQTPNYGNVGLIDALAAWDLVDLAYTHGYNHLVQKAQPDTMREIRAARLMNQNPDMFFDFPISTVLSPRTAGPETEKSLTLLEWALSKHSDKNIILSSIGQIFDEARLNESLRDDLILTADEFMCNVLFNATQKGGVNRNTISTSLQSAEIAMPRPAILRMGAFNGYLALSCMDMHGTLDPKRFLHRLHLCLSQGAGDAINLTDQGTAGIGGFMVFNACSSLFIGVRGGKASMFCALFPLKAGAKARSTQPKHLHWMQY